MAIIKVTKRKVKKPQNASAMRNLIDYVKKHERENGLAIGFNCNTASAFQEFLLNKKIHHKTDGRLYIHMIQSFPKDLITPEKAFELGQKLINEHPQFANFQIVMGTHTDREHIHNHFCINSVGMDGKKWQLSDTDLNGIREKSLDICREAEVPIWWDKNNVIFETDKPLIESQKDDQLNTVHQGEYEKQKQGKSWSQIINAAVQCELSKSINYDDFKKNMQDKHKITVNERGQTVTYRMEGMGRAMRGRMLGLGFELNTIGDIESVIKKSQELHTVHQGEYEKQKQGKSWKYELFLGIRECTKHAHSQDEFITNMNKLGYGVQWDHHKYITFSTPDGKKCRNNKLYPTERFTKEYLLDQFEKNAERRSQQTIRDHQQQMDHTVNLVNNLLRTVSRKGSLSGDDEFFPLTHIKSKLEGQALKDKAIEKSNSSYNWDKEF
ncbi:relaxase/mobilization nuclease domain-containing protein [Acetobacterium wieringae]|uniref:relaxase/mobilization nuclease domain-containing protein n=1 Tax=Acetobacterium wieringae TaxID=52694 RepID=UPI002B219DED|nr:relaxase/mobilization nuclease domain-containing protein [Acetobacterium wieringae]MEA4805047.1 relaxase/mobilization nuclease domain-containing protein [Acetobacterium wieringae]